MSERPNVLFASAKLIKVLPIPKEFVEICGTTSLYPAGPDGLIPLVPTPVVNPRELRLAKPLLGFAVCTEVRKKLARTWFTFDPPNVFTSPTVNIWAREGLVVENPGTLLPPSGLATVASSQ